VQIQIAALGSIIIVTIYLKATCNNSTGNPRVKPFGLTCFYKISSRPLGSDW